MQHNFIVSPDAGVVEDVEEFETWEALEARYYDVVERAQADDTLRGTLLIKDGDIPHDWPPDEWEQPERQEYTIWIAGEDRDPGYWNPRVEQTSVTVTFTDGTPWVASFA